jgi:hypothetical protein
MRQAPSFLRRLTNAEYDATVRDLVGATGETSKAFSFPADTLVAGYTFNGEFDTVGPPHLERYGSAAQALAAGVMTSAARRAAVLGCDPSAEDRAACLRSFIERFGRRAFRRPLEAAEQSNLVALAAAQGDADPFAGAQIVLEAILQAPQFLFRIEGGVADATRPALLRLDGFAIAARLSYLLRGSTPPDALLDAAASGRLDTPEGVAAAARDLLGQPPAREAFRMFSRQWLRLGALGAAVKDAALFPAWNEGLRAAMTEETLRVVDDLIWRDGASFLDLLTAPFTYVNGPLAALYGLVAPGSGGFSRVDLAGSDRRMGLLTHAGVLAANSRRSHSSPTLRGVFVREVMLCEGLPDPPDDVSINLPPPMPNETEREQLERHARDPECFGCHVATDQIGYGLERYDAIGVYRTTDARGRPISTAGRILGMTPDGFDGAFELGRRIAGSEQHRDCVVVQALRYALGRRDTDEDRCLLRRLSSSFVASGGSLRDLFVGITISDPFRFKDIAVATGGGK